MIRELFSFLISTGRHRQTAFFFRHDFVHAPAHAAQVIIDYFQVFLLFDLQVKHGAKNQHQHVARQVGDGGHGVCV